MEQKVKIQFRSKAILQTENNIQIRKIEKKNPTYPESLMA